MEQSDDVLKHIYGEFVGLWNELKDLEDDRITDSDIWERYNRQLDRLAELTAETYKDFKVEPG